MSSFHASSSSSASAAAASGTLPPCLVQSPLASSSAFSEIDWSIFSQAGTLTEADAAVIRMGETNVLSYVLADAKDSLAYAGALLKTLVAVKRDRTVTHFALTRIIDVLCTHDVVRGVDCVEALFWDRGAKAFVDNFKPFEDHISSRDSWIATAAAFCAATILVPTLTSDGSSSTNSNNTPLQKLVSHSCGSLNAGKDGVTSCLPVVTVLVANDVSREALGKAGAVGYLTRHLKLSNSASSGEGAGGSGGLSSTLSAQTVYEICFTLWTLSFSPKHRSDFVSHTTTSVLVTLAGRSPREKTTRVALATLVNLLCGEGGGEEEGGGVSVPSSTFISEALQTNFLRTLTTLQTQAFTDTDIAEDVTLLHKTISDNYKQFSTWEKYEVEVASGALQWGATHTTEFWREYSKSMEGRDFRVLKMLIGLLGGDDDETVAVACFDIGEWARFFPNGKALVKKLGGKDKVMGLMAHENEEVGKQALLSVSKLCVEKWEFVA
jgi:V-type H+-transporting ATPase subunit H